MQSVIDIEGSEKIKSSPGYRQWAAIFNLKQSAAALNLIQEYGGINAFDELYKDAIGVKLDLAQEMNAADARYKQNEAKLKEMATIRKNLYSIIRQNKSREQSGNNHIGIGAGVVVKLCGVLLHFRGDRTNEQYLYYLEGDYMELNEIWERHIKDSGADFVYFVDVSMLQADVTDGYTCAVLFGKALSREYISTLRDGQEPKRKEVFNTEHKMDALAVKLADRLDTEGYKSVAKLKFGGLPHKTVALRAGLGFIGKNNLLVTAQYGCALMLGKVLTTAPFETMSKMPKEPQCGDCNICVNVCPTKALHGKTWSVTTTRDEIMTRKLCTLCLKCMIWCPHTAEYAK